MHKKKTLKNTTKLICRSALLFFILIPALMIMIPGCNPFGKCGKPGFRTVGNCNDGNADYIYYDCASPCSPSVDSTQENFITGTHYSSTTVYCKDSGTFGYDTSDGIKAGWTCH